MFGRILLEPQGGEGGNDTVAETPAEGKGPDLSKAAANLVAKHGSHDAALLVLLGENFREREEKRELRTRLPKDGALILEGDDARHWSTYKQLGSPGDLKKSLEAGKQYEAEASTFRRAEVHRSAAEIHGFKASVLGTLAEKLEIEIGETRGKDGKAVRVAFVKGDGDEKTPLNEYAEARWADFLPSLRLEAEKPRPAGTPTTQRPRTVPAGHGAAAEKRAPRSTF